MTRRRGQPSSSALQEAERLLDAAAQGQAVRIGSRRLCGAFVFLLDLEADLARRQLIVELVLTSTHATSRHLFVLWQESSTHRTRIAHALADAMEAADQEGRAYGFAPPGWLPPEHHSRRGTLRSPVDTCAVQLLKKPGTIDEIEERLGVNPRSSLGRALLGVLLRHGTAQWWHRLGSPREMRDWAEGKGLDSQKLVIERQLLIIGGAGRNALLVAELPEAQALASATLKLLHDPATSPGRWQGISKEARAIFEWLLVRDELLKIFEAFRRGASKRDRADFWASQAADIRDARCISVQGMAVCLMIVRRFLIIEFGDVGNAGYIYHLPPTDLPPLRTLGALPKSIFRFKSRDQITLAGYDLRHYDRILHRGNWNVWTERLLRGQPKRVPW